MKAKCSGCKATLNPGQVCGLSFPLGSQEEPTVLLVVCAHCGTVLGVVPKAGMEKSLYTRWKTWRNSRRVMRVLERM